MEKWGYLRECREKAIGTDKATGLNRTGFDDYARIIFPDVTDWVHDKVIPGVKRKLRPDWRSDSLKLIVEFDGLQHYRSPIEILKDKDRTVFYESLGYRVVRIPFFIQLSNSAVKTMFDVEVAESLFDEYKYPSMNVEEKCTPAFMCPSGIERMSKELSMFPVQCKVNINYLEQINNEFLTGVSLLKEKININMFGNLTKCSNINHF